MNRQQRERRRGTLAGALGVAILAVVFVVLPSCGGMITGHYSIEQPSQR